MTRTFSDITRLVFPEAAHDMVIFLHNRTRPSTIPAAYGGVNQIIKVFRKAPLIQFFMF